MPLYGSIAGVKELAMVSADDAPSAADTSRLTNLLALSSRYLEEAINATFGEAGPPAETREIYGQGDARLVLFQGVRSVVSILENPTTWNGTAWTGGTSLTSADYRLEGLDEHRTGDASLTTAYHELRKITGRWFGLYIINGVWENKYPTVPADITYIANRLAYELFKAEKASPHGLTGPDGAQINIRNALTIPEIRATIESYKVAPR